MYLYAEKYISPYDYEMRDGEMTRRDNLQHDKVIQSAEMDGLPSGEYGGVTVSRCVGYWRKANAIHGWIVRELAGDVDKCQRIDMSREDLIRLRNVCVGALHDRSNAKPDTEDTYEYRMKSGEADNTEHIVMSMVEVMKNEAMKRTTKAMATEQDPIPPTAGFFFGGTEKSEYYYSSLERTVELINSILASDSKGEYSYYYQASW